MTSSTRNQPSLFGEQPRTLAEAVHATMQAFRHIDAARYDRWVIGYSGGKDSTTVVTLLAHLIEIGQIQRPPHISVLYADTGMEVPPLQQAALQTLAVLKERYGFDTHVVRPALDERFFVYMLGRGVPPPNNGRMRWCTRVLKITPMAAQMAHLNQVGERVLLLTGLREGESAARDGRITAACSKDGGECGQGYLYVHTASATHADPFAPILSWRVCHVADWLLFFAPACFAQSTGQIVEIYGYESEDGQAEPLAARTGCMRCRLVQTDRMMERVLAIPRYRYLAPVNRLTAIYDTLVLPTNRLRKDGTQRLKDGSIPANLQRMGPLTMEARRWGLAQIKAIQEEVNAAAHVQGMPTISLISEEEERRILDLIATNT